MQKNRTCAIILAAGQGKRMNSHIQKQYLLLNGKPLIYYALEAFEKSSIDEIILVVGSGEISYCKNEIIESYGFTKVSHIVEGGKERYHSVYEGLKTITDCAYVLIHDGARPLITSQVISRAIEGAKLYQACAVGVSVKDTIKIADSAGYAKETPDRSFLWAIQTPQSFAYEVIRKAYDQLFDREELITGITDDAMVVEMMTDFKVKLIQGEYSNLKVTTPEDIKIAEVLLNVIR